MPHDLDAEQALIGAALSGFADLPALSRAVSGPEFYRPAHEQIWEACLAVHATGYKPDPIIVADHLGPEVMGKVGGPIYLAECIEACPAGAQTFRYAEIIRGHAVRRQVIEMGVRFQQLGSDEDAEDLLASCRQWMADLDGHRPTGRISAIDSMAGVLDIVDKGALAGLPTPWADLNDFIIGARPGQLIVFGARTSVGKALALDTPLPTPTGWTTMGEIQVGDQVLGADGKPTDVAVATEVMNGRPCYRVGFSDGSEIVADADHLWRTSTRSERRAASPTKTIRTTREIAATLAVGAYTNHQVEVCEAFDLPDQDLLVDPYTLGCWLGDGNSSGSGFTTADPEILEGIERGGYVVRKCPARYQYKISLPGTVDRAAFADRPCRLCGTVMVRAYQGRQYCGHRCARLGSVAGHKANGTTGCVGCGTTVRQGAMRCRACAMQTTLTGQLRSLGLIGNKHIPGNYLRASGPQRMALLQGLMDTDGTVSAKSGRCSFDVTSESLAAGALELALSLGIKAKMATRVVKGRTPQSSICYRVGFTTTMPVFRLTRKANRLPVSLRTNGRMIVSAQPIPSVSVRCIKVSNRDHMFLAGRSCVPTHNSLALENLATHWARDLGRPVLFSSLEMSHTEITQRTLAWTAKVDLSRIIRGGDSLTDLDRSRIDAASAEVMRSLIEYDDRSGQSVADIRAAAWDAKQKATRAGKEFGGVFVDYIQLVRVPKSSKAMSRQQQLGEITRDLKSLGKELGCPVVTASQVNRSPMARQDKTPQLSDLREAGDIENDADVVILLHEELVEDSGRMLETGELDMIVAKNRNGPKGTRTVRKFGHFARLEAS